jgi:hypothetical protein
VPLAFQGRSFRAVVPAVLRLDSLSSCVEGGLMATCNNLYVVLALSCT